MQANFILTFMENNLACIIYRVIRSKMQTKHLNFLSRIVVGAEADSTTKYLIFLVLVTAFGPSGSYALSELASNTSWDVTCSSTILNHHFFDAAVEQNGVIPENEDSYGLDSKDSPERGSVLVADSLNYLIHISGSEILLDSINSFHYVLTYVYSPLRSPPIFS
jgi:hypothetical protein